MAGDKKIRPRYCNFFWDRDGGNLDAELDRLQNPDRGCGGYHARYDELWQWLCGAVVIGKLLCEL